jgi:hypothetical protein
VSLDHARHSFDAWNVVRVCSTGRKRNRGTEVAIESEVPPVQSKKAKRNSRESRSPSAPAVKEVIRIEEPDDAEMILDEDDDDEADEQQSQTDGLPIAEQESSSDEDDDAEEDEADQAAVVEDEAKEASDSDESSAESSVDDDETPQINQAGRKRSVSNSELDQDVTMSYDLVFSDQSKKASGKGKKASPIMKEMQATELAVRHVAAAIVKEADASKPSPIKAPLIKPWRAPVGAAGTISFNSSDGSGLVSASAKLFHIKVIVVGDIGYSVARASRVARKYVLAINLETRDTMVLVGYADDATKYMANFITDKCYTVRLETRPAPQDKPLCLPHLTHFYKTVMNSPIKPYVAPDPADGDNLEESHEACKALTTHCKPINALRDASENDVVCFAGVVMDVEAIQMRNSNGVKVLLADANAMVKVMFFEGKNVKRGDRMMIIGGKVWISPKTKAKEVSVWSTAIVSVNTFVLSKKIMDICVKQSRANLIDVSAVPSYNVRSMTDLKEEALGVAEGEMVHGTALLQLDPYKLSNGGAVTYNGCHACMKAVVVTGQDGEGNAIYAHASDGNHAARTYTAHYYFDGRFKEEEEDPAYYVAKIDDALGLGIFGMTAEELSNIADQTEVAKILDEAARRKAKYNVSIMNNGEIAQIVRVNSA